MNSRIKALVKLADYIKTHKSEMDILIQKAFQKNAWFDSKSIQLALDHIVECYLSEAALVEWVKKYSIQEIKKSTKVGIIMAGNIPLVGFHDWLSCFISGFDTKVKLSSKDDVLLKELIKQLYLLNDDNLPITQFVEKLSGFDAVIATGTNNSAMHFEQYFEKYPSIIRRNRTSIAILDGNESREQLLRLGHDIFDYFGMGCRNVSKIYIPSNYDFTLLKDVLENQFSILQHHHKYRNNYDYNYTIFLMNEMKHIAFSTIILVENKDIYSRMASLHYEFYSDHSTLLNNISHQKHNIQCVVSDMNEMLPLSERLGNAQKPELANYADGVDTIEFLSSLN